MLLWIVLARGRFGNGVGAVPDTILNLHSETVNPSIDYILDTLEIRLEVDSETVHSSIHCILHTTAVRF